MTPQDLIFQALGAASMCWIPRPSDQEFDSQTAVEVGEQLIRDLKKLGVNL